MDAARRSTGSKRGKDPEQRQAVRGRGEAGVGGAVLNRGLFR